MTSLKIVISKQTIRDIDEAIFYKEKIGTYQENIKSFKESVISQIKNLSISPNIGAKLSTRISVDSDVKYLVIDDYLLFYEVFVNEVKILRLLPAKSNWMNTIMRNF